MRISAPSQYRTMLNDLQNQLYAQYQIQKQITTGKQASTPSEAGGNADTILYTHLAIEQISQYSTNLEMADSWLQSSETAMQNLVDILKQAKTLAEKMSTGTMDSLEHETAAEEVANIYEQVVTLANTKISGSYLFSGTLTGTQPVTTKLGNPFPAELSTDSGPGSGTVADVVSNPVSPGDVAFQLTRDTTGALANIIISASNTLGENGIFPPLSFDAGLANWIHNTVASDDTGSADIYTLRYGFSSGTDAVSARVGETFSWTADADVGEQTFNSYCKVSFTGAGAATLDVGGVPTYTANSAQEMVEAINSAGADYYAYADGDDVYIMIKDGVPAGTFYDITDGGGPIDVSYPTLDDLTNQINDGRKAQGMVSIDNAALPGLTDTITVGDYSWTWEEITDGTLPADADGYATALASWIGANTDDFSAVATTGAASADASVIITANAEGKAGNVQLTGTGVTTSNGLMGGIDGTDHQTTGRLYIDGSCDYELETNLRCEVLDVDGSDVTVRVRWYDDDGTRHEEDLTLSAAGDDNGVAIPGMPGVTLYRDDLVFEEGAVMDIELTHYQGNQEDIDVSFSKNSHMRYNWNASELLGGSLTVDLYGETAAKVSGTGSGSLHMDGAYRGLYPETFDFDIIDGGQVPGDDVTVRVQWVDENGNTHDEEMTFSGTGAENAQEIPGADGASFYLDSGTYQQGDSFTYSVEKETLQLMDMFTLWGDALLSGDQETAQTMSQEALAVIDEALEQIMDLIADSGARQTRISVRESVMEDQELFHTDVLEDVEAVDTTQAFLQLNMLQTSYTTTLQVTSSMSDMFLLNYL